MEQSNSYLFHVKLALILSSMVQMKNSLMKYLDYEINDANPEMNLMTQVPQVITDLEEESTQAMSVLTPISFREQRFCDKPDASNPPAAFRDCLNLMVFHDDPSFFINYMVQSLCGKGVKIVRLPSMYDAKSIIPFLLLNDHCILLVQNPKKDILSVLKGIIRNGVIWYNAENGQAKPIKVNITIWVFMDILPWLEKLTKVPKKNQHAPPKMVKEVFESMYGNEGREIMKLFDVVMDGSQYSNIEIMGSRYLKY